MIPLRLQLQGIYSYRHPTTIEFDRLNRAGLFGLFGPVGSGKSTILEAMGYALYGGTERLGAKDFKADLLNLSSHELAVTFDFEVGNPARVYRFHRTYRRNKKDPAKIGASHEAKYRWDGHDWEPLSTSAEEVLQLSYDNFRRTIIIPQGKFSEFLSLRGKERSEMLQQIFSLERFDLGPTCQELLKECRWQLDSLNGQLEQLGQASPEALAQAKEEEAKQQKAREQQRQKRDQLQAQKEKFDQYKTWHDSLLEAQNRLAKLQERQAEIREQEQKLHHYQLVYQALGTVFEQGRKAQERQQAQQKALKKAQSQQQKAEEAWKTFEQNYRQAKTEYDQRDQREEQLRLLETQESYLRLSQQISAEEKRLAQDQQALEQIRQTRQTLSEKEHQQAEHLREQKAQLLDAQLLETLSNWYQQDQHLRQNLRECQQNQAELSAKCPEGRQAELQAAIAEAKEDLSSLEQQLAQNETRRQKAQTHLELSKMAGRLNEGEPCPLCGATAHPEVSTPEGAEEEANAAHAEYQRLKQAEQKARKTLQEYEKALTEWQTNSGYLQQAQQATEAAEKALAQHRQRFQWQEAGFDPDDPKAFEQSRQTHYERQKALDALEKDQEKTRQKLEEEARKLEQTQQKLQQEEQKLAERRGQRNGLLAKYPKEQLETEHSEAELQQEIAALRQKLNDAEQRFQQLESQWEAQNKAYQEAQENLKLAQNALQTTEKEREELLAEWNKGLAGLPEEAQNQATALLQNPPDTEALQKAIEDYRHQWSQAQGQKEKAEGALKDSGFSPEKYETLKQQAEQAQKDYEALIEKHRQAQNQLAQLKEDLKKKEQLQKQQAAQRQREHNLKELEKLFKGHGFVKYVSSLYLKNLLQNANQRFFRLTNHSLKLELGDDYAIQVVDYLNNGQRRQAKTLSGGQTFKASLSLALALADSVRESQGSKRQFFFLDEGFGALDPQSLDEVFEVLSSLRSENRILGLISHVEALKEKVPEHLTFENDPVYGSRILEQQKEASQGASA